MLIMGKICLKPLRGELLEMLSSDVIIDSL